MKSRQHTIASPTPQFVSQNSVKTESRSCGKHSEICSGTSRIASPAVTRPHDRMPARRTLQALASSGSDELFDPLVAGVRDYAIFLLDPGGHVRSWNAGAERIKGYRAGEILGQHFSRFYDSESVLAGKPESELQAAQATGRFEDEGWRLRKDGSRFWANVVITALRNDEGTTSGYLKITRDLTERKESEERLRQANANLETRVEERTAELASTNRQLAASNDRLQSEVMERTTCRRGPQGGGSPQERVHRHAQPRAEKSPRLSPQRAAPHGARGWRTRDDGGETQAMMERQVESTRPTRRRPARCVSHRAGQDRAAQIASGGR